MTVLFSMNWPTVAVSDDMVIVTAGDLEGRLLTEGEYSGTLMLFGGTELPHRNAISPLFLAALDSVDAGAIYARYPDFHLCNSPGAELAKPLVQDINIIPSDRSTQTALVNALREFHHNLRSDGERVCVTVSGRSASLLAVRIPAHDIDITREFPTQRYLVIENARKVDCQTALEHI